MPFLDIFSSSKEINEEKPLVIADNREKNSLVISELLNNPHINVEFQQLPIADYLIGEIAIERKTISDFKSSIIDKRIFEQLKNIRQYPKYILIIEEDQKDKFLVSRMNENAFRSFLLSLVLNNTPLLFTKSSEETAKYLSIIALKKENSTPLSLRPKKIKSNKKEKLQYILEGFPSIGKTKARNLLNYFNSLENIFKAEEEDLKKVLGKKAKEFKEIIKSNVNTES